MMTSTASITQHAVLFGGDVRPAEQTTLRAVAEKLLTEIAVRTHNEDVRALVVAEGLVFRRIYHFTFMSSDSKILFTLDNFTLPEAIAA